MKRIITHPLVYVFLLGVLLRFHQISQIPACMNWDEASFLFNARSILETGKDEYGTLLPLEFKSIGDYKFPGFIYLTTLPVQIFGATTFAVRFLPALLGSFTVPILYFLAKLLFRNKNIALLASFLLAISPWHLQFTRAGADVGVSSFFVVLGIYLSIRAIEHQRARFLPALLAFSGSIYTYFVDRIFVPMILLVIAYSYKGKVKRNNLFKDLVIFLLILAPAIFLTLGAGQSEKLQKTTLFGLSRSQEYVENLSQFDSSFEFNLFHGAAYEKGLGMLDRYLAHFSFEFLFTNGANYDLRQQIFGMGVMYAYQAPFLLIGLYQLIKKRGRSQKFILLWLLISPIPAAITRDPVHARRSFNMVYPVALITALGLYSSIMYFRRSGIVKAWMFYFSLAGLFAYFTLFYLLSYFIFTPKRVSRGPAGFNCGYEELVNYVSPIKDKYDKIIIDTTYQGPYLYFLLYENYPPQDYQKQAVLVQDSPASLGEGKGYDKYEFRPIYYPDDKGLSNTLLVGPPERIPLKDIEAGATLIKKIYFQTGEVYFHVVETDKLDF